MKKMVSVLGILIVLLVATTPATAETVFVDVDIDGLENIDLGAFDFDFNYNADKFIFERYFIGDALGSLALGEAEDWSYGDGFSGAECIGAGTVNLSVVSSLSDLSAQPEAFTLVTLAFSSDSSVAASDYAEFTLSNVDLSDLYGDSIAFAVSGTNISTSAIPVPAGVWLLGSGLLGLITLRRQRRG